VLLDLNLPSGSGLEVLRRLLVEDPDAGVLIFSMHSESFYVARAMEAGARGYISKSAPATGLVAAIQAIAAGARYVEKEIACQRVVSRYDKGRQFNRLSIREAVPRSVDTTSVIPISCSCQRCLPTRGRPKRESGAATVR